MTLPRKSASRYELERSALYRLPSVKALANALLWDGPPSALRALSKRPDNFKEYEKKNPVTGKSRKIQSPSLRVKPIQKRLNVLLKQIIVPDYLQSGTPGRSHLSNSQIHLEKEGATVTVDVSKFYESISRRRVFRLFRNVFDCESDIADVIADLVCCNGHLATGSPSSVLLSYFACKDMFDLINERVSEQGATFTLYIDDIAISGNTIGHGDIKFLERTLRQFGFESKKEKTKVFRKEQAKIVTGRAFRDGVSRAPNRSHLAMRDAIMESQANAHDVKKKRSAVGKLDYVGMLDDKRGVELKEKAQKIRATLPPIKALPHKKHIRVRTGDSV
jgi:Reverse transcriptase (RNA-dependent DNA polymerase)